MFNLAHLITWAQSNFTHVTILPLNVSGVSDLADCEV